MDYEVAVTPPNHPSVRALVFCALDELNRRYGANADDASLNFEELEPPRGAFFVAREGGHLAGGVALRTISEPDQGIMEIKRLWVRPDLRGRGVARVLMHAAEEWARGDGRREIYLETGDKQPEAVALYHALHYERVTAFPEGVPHYPEGIKFRKSL